MRNAQLHESLGVRWDVAGDARLPRNYGDPAAEYAAARSDAAVVDRADRRIVRVHGRDPVRMVQGLVSNDVPTVAHGRAVYAAVLTPKGRMVADVRIVKHGDDLLLDVDAAAAEPLTTHLRKYVPPLFARFEDASDAWCIIGVHGPRARALVQQVTGAALLEAFVEDEAVPAEYDRAAVIIMTTSHADVDGYDLLCEARVHEPLWRALADAGAKPLGHATLDVLRIEAGRPRWGAELGEATIPLEAGLRSRAISETKGCYTGQEVIVRILQRGHVNWVLRRVLLGDAAAPPRDAPLHRAGEAKQVGRVTSTAWSPKYGEEIGLAYVRREVEPPAELRLGSPDGAVVKVLDIDARD